jgi:hypothetical protein
MGLSGKQNPEGLKNPWGFMYSKTLLFDPFQPVSATLTAAMGVDAQTKSGAQFGTMPRLLRSNMQ